MAFHLHAVHHRSYGCAHHMIVASPSLPSWQLDHDLYPEPHHLGLDASDSHLARRRDVPVNFLTDVMPMSAERKPGT